jgi:galactoside O-acetyltransferase
MGKRDRLSVLSWWRALRWIITDNLGGPEGGYLREVFWRKRLAKLGENISFGERLRITCPSSIVIGSHFSCWRDCAICADRDSRISIDDHVAFNQGVYVNAALGRGITIGKKVMIGPGVMLRASNHRTDDAETPMHDQGHVPGEIIIADDVWIGSGVVISGTVCIGRGAVIGANSVVTRDIPEYAFAGGVPARIIHDRRERWKQKQTEQHRKPGL